MTASVTQGKEENHYKMMKTAFFPKLKKCFIPSVAVFILLAFIASVAVLHAGDTPLPKWPQELSDLPADPSVIFGRFSNGFGYILKVNHEPKDRVSMHLNIRAGSFLEADDQQGVAHFLEHMQFNGSTHFKPGELVKYFQTIGMQFGPDANAHTGFTETVFDVVLPGGDSKSIAGGLRVLKDYAEGALLLTSEVDRERGVILAEKRSRDSVDYRTFVATLGFEFPDARISKRLPIGDDSVLKSVGRDRIKAFYDAWYRPEKMVLILVGDFDPKTALPQIAEAFSTITARAPALPEPDTGRIQHQGDKYFYHYEPEDGNTSVSIEAIWKVAKSADSLVYQQQELLRNIANSIVKNRLSELAQKPETPFTSASVHSGRYLEDIEFVEISATCGPDKWSATVSTLEQVLRSAIEHGFTRSELERVKKDYLAELDNAVKQAPTRNSNDIAQEILRSVNTDRVYMSAEQEKSFFSPFITSLDLATVHAAFQQNWARDHRLFQVTGNAEIDAGKEGAELKIRSIIGESRQKAVFKPAEALLVRFPYLEEPVGGTDRILNREDVPDLGIVQIDLKNGVRLNLKQTDFEADKVRMTLSFGRGKSNEPKEKPGLSVLAEAVVNESGFAGLTKDELERALAGKEWKLNFHVEEDYFSFAGESSSQELALMFQLLYAHMVDPGFRPEAFKLATDRLGQMYQSLSRDIEGAMQLEGQRFYSGGDSRFGLPSFDHFRQLKLSDAKEWLLPLLKDAPVEVSLVGAFDLKKAIDLATTYLGALNNRNPLDSIERNGLPRFPSGKALFVNVETQIPKGLIVVAYPTEDFWDIKRTRRLSVVADIVSEKLRETVREKLGVSYSPYAYNRPSRAYPGYGLLQAFVYIDPDKAEMVIDEVKKIGIDISRDGISPGELARSIEPIVTNIKEMRRTNAYWLRSVMVGSSRHPEQFDWSRTILSDFAAITPAEISALARKYLVAEKAAQIIIRPGKTTAVQ
ncbi:MAG: insulinase family protein [Pseudomonadota bacterium]